MAPSSARQAITSVTHREPSSSGRPRRRRARPRWSWCWPQRPRSAGTRSPPPPEPPHRPSRSPAPTPSALHAAAAPRPTRPDPPAAPAPGAALVAARLAPALGAAALGPRVRARVVDLRAAPSLYDRGGASPVAPASTAKLLAAAALFAVRAADRPAADHGTRGPGGALVLVGGGDPTLTGARPGGPAATRRGPAQRPGRAGARGRRPVDQDRRRRRAVHRPDGLAGLGGRGRAERLRRGDHRGPGRRRPRRSGRPRPQRHADLAAGHELAAALGRPGLPVVRGTAPAGARAWPRCASAPLGTLVQQMMLESDNVIAECLARQVALAEKMPPSFTGAAAAIRASCAARSARRRRRHGRRQRAGRARPGEPGHAGRGAARRATGPRLRSVARAPAGRRLVGHARRALRRAGPAPGPGSCAPRRAR